MVTFQFPQTLSEAERSLYDHLQRHIKAESGMMDLYASLADAHHPYISFLAALIGEDEARHHRIFEEWIDSLRAMAELDRAADSIPNVDRLPVRPETMALVDRLLAFEKDDLAAVRQLRKDVDNVGDFGVWQVVLETLVYDTEKHITILKFIKKQLQAAR